MSKTWIALRNYGDDVPEWARADDWIYREWCKLKEAEGNGHKFTHDVVLESGNIYRMIYGQWEPAAQGD